MILNNIVIVLHLTLHIAQWITAEKGVGGANDYCLMEAFQPECRRNEVIIMKSAVYGRMKISRCISSKEIAVLGQDQNYLGCYSNVLGLLDKRCSGKIKCEVRIPDNNLEDTQPCNPGLKMYLEAHYECVAVIEHEGYQSCTLSANQNFKHLKITNSNTCGSNVKPWIIETSLGKTIQISLFNFESKNWTHQEIQPSTCVRIGSITDKIGKKQIPICNDGTRFKDLLSSQGNSVEIVFDNESRGSYLLRFIAVGCTDIIPAEDSWIKRDGSHLVVGCYASRKSWTLTCREDRWIGTLGNCSHVIEGESNLFSESELSLNDRTLNIPKDQQILVIVAIAGFGLVVCLITACLGIVCVKKFYSTKSHLNGANFQYANVILGDQNIANGTLHDKTMRNLLMEKERYEESKYFVLDDNVAEVKANLT